MFFVKQKTLHIHVLYNTYTIYTIHICPRTTITKATWRRSLLYLRWRSQELSTSTESVYLDSYSSYDDVVHFQFCVFSLSTGPRRTCFNLLALITWLNVYCSSVSSFYRAMLRKKSGIATASCPSVRPPVCLSVTLRHRDHIGWNTSKMIPRLLSLECSLFADPTSWIYTKGNTPKFGPE